MAIDEALLAANRTKWDRVGFVFNPEAANPQALQERARRFLQEAAATSDRFAIKEPRMARLLDFWKPQFAETGWDCRYVIALRNPISVAASLHKLQRIDATQAALLWADYLINAIHSTNGENRVILDYDRLLAYPEEVLRAAGEALGEPNHDLAEMRDFCDSFLASELRHSTHDLSEVFASPDIPALVAIFYLQLLRCAAGELALESQEIKTSITAIEHLWRELAPVWQWLGRLQDEAEALTAGIKSRDDRIISLSAYSALTDIQIAELHQVLAIRDRDINELRQVLATRDQEIDQLRKHLAARDGNIDDLRKLLAARDSHIAGREAELANREQTIAERDAWISTLTSSKSWKLTQPLRRLRTRLAKLRSYTKRL